jgi:hypothetical protein
MTRPRAVWGCVPLSRGVLPRAATLVRRDAGLRAHGVLIQGQARSSRLAAHQVRSRCARYRRAVAALTAPLVDRAPETLS